MHALRHARTPCKPPQEILEYLKQRTAEREATAAAAAAATAAAATGPKLLPGSVNLFFGEEELDAGGSLCSHASAAARCLLPRRCDGAQTGGPRLPTAPPVWLSCSLSLPIRLHRVLPPPTTTHPRDPAVLAAHPDRLVVLMASVTWCRPCKGFQENYEAGAAAPLACVPLLVALVLDVPSAAHLWPWVGLGVGPHGRVGQKVGAAGGRFVSLCWNPPSTSPLCFAR